eukprot:469688_1
MTSKTKGQRIINCKMKNNPCKSHDDPTCTSCRRHKKHLVDILVDCNYTNAEWRNYKSSHCPKWHPNKNPDDPNNYEVVRYQEKKRKRDKQKALSKDAIKSRSITEFGINYKSTKTNVKPKSNKSSKRNLSKPKNSINKSTRQSTLHSYITHNSENKEEESSKMNDKVDNKCTDSENKEEESSKMDDKIDNKCTDSENTNSNYSYKAKPSNSKNHHNIFHENDQFYSKNKSNEFDVDMQYDNHVNTNYG